MLYFAPCGVDRQHGAPARCGRTRPGASLPLAPAPRNCPRRLPSHLRRGGPRSRHEASPRAPSPSAGNGAPSTASAPGGAIRPVRTRARCAARSRCCGAARAGDRPATSRRIRRKAVRAARAADTRGAHPAAATARPSIRARTDPTARRGRLRTRNDRVEDPRARSARSDASRSVALRAAAHRAAPPARRASPQPA